MRPLRSGPRGGTCPWGQYKTPDMRGSIRAQRAFSSSMFQFSNAFSGKGLIKSFGTKKMELTTTLICRTSNRESHSLSQMLPHFGQTASSKLHSHPEDDIRSLQEKSYRTEICFFLGTRNSIKRLRK